MKTSNILKNSIYRTGIDERSNLNPVRFSIFITILYMVFVSAYIWFSGRIALLFSSSVEDLAMIELVKGLLYVLITTTILFFCVYVLLKKVEIRDNTIISQNKSIILAERLVMAGKFSLSVCHDINNLMSIIVGNTSLLSLNVKSDKRNIEHLEQISTASEKLIDLVQRLMDAGKNYIPGGKELQDISSVVEEIINFSKIHKKLKKCTIQTEIQSDLTLNVNSVLLGRTIMNLMLNAAEATNEAGNILIRLAKADDKVVLEVHDNGPGIDDNLKEKILEPFYTSKTDGNGLGLLSLKICAQQHDAEIAIKISHLGGACFSLSFPFKDTLELEL
ncbi:MAG: HAMP domain-containing histidine kinase [Candidatus Delongbacteria bacterium]|nr:HAMP domain-containing histidine kinase [Candidatus Delongbacteria bacterium]